MLDAPDPDACPSCGSGLTQPLRWTDGLIALRCPECHSCFRVLGSPAVLQALEGRQAAAREALVAAHEEALAGSVLTLDDVAPRPPAAP